MLIDPLHIPPTPPSPLTDAVIGAMQLHEFKERPYMGLRSLSGFDMAGVLRGCLADNAWPDWLEYYHTAAAMGVGIMSTIDTIEAAIKATGWPQSLRDVMQEIQCRAQHKFVIQEPHARFIVNSPLTVGGPK